MLTPIVAVLLSCAASVAAVKCPENFKLWYDNVCGYTKINNVTYTFTFDMANQTCHDLGAQLPSIHSEKENGRLFAAVMNSTGWKNDENHQGDFWIGLQCQGNHNYSWMDGTPYDYANTYIPDHPGCNPSLRYFMYDLSHNNDWDWADGWQYTSTIACVIHVDNDDSLCGDFEELTTDDSKCVKLFPSALPWPDAENTCKNNGAHLFSIHSSKDNDYVRRTAIANGIVDGMHIGLLYTNANWTWTDGSAADYNNFAPGFPDSNTGNCTSMQITFQSGKWMNTDCPFKLPFVCSRPAKSQPAGCSNKPKFVVGDHIYSPSYPSRVDADFCEYAVVADSKTARVGVQVVAFDTIPGTEVLQIYDDLFGRNLIATLSGHVDSGAKYTATVQSLRIVWNSTETSKQKGWHFTVFEV